MPQKLKSESERGETKYKMFETNIYNFNNKVQFYEIEVMICHKMLSWVYKIESWSL